jgi:hypothetical protein
MNKGLPQLEESPVLDVQIKMFNHFLSGSGIGAYEREVLTTIIRRGSYNKTHKDILNSLRDRFMAEVVHKNDGTTRYYVVVDSTDMINPIKAFKFKSEAEQISKTIDIIYANSTENPIKLFMTILKKSNG